MENDIEDNPKNYNNQSDYSDILSLSGHNDTNPKSDSCEFKIYDRLKLRIN